MSRRNRFGGTFVVRGSGLTALVGLLALLATGLFTATRIGTNDVSGVVASGTTLRRATPAEADILVTVRGVGICSGAPVSGTRMVVTAAHCLLDTRTGTLSTRHDLRVEREGVRYDIEAVIFDPNAATRPLRPAADAAILLMRTRIPGPGVNLPRGRVDDSDAVLIGLQPVGPDGAFQRGTTYHTRRTPDGASPGALYTAHVPAACDAGPARVARGFATYRCGMVPGGSGGPVLAAGTTNLVGIISSVDRELTRNGVAPTSAILELLEHAETLTIRPDTPALETNRRR